MSVRDLSDLELRALAFVDERELVRDLVDLVAVPSVSGHDAESDIQHRLAKRLGGLDLDLWPLDLPALTADPPVSGVGGPAVGGLGARRDVPGTRGRSARAGAAGPRGRGPARRPQPLVG